jgi:quinol monooxygenase YgiN
MVTEARLVRLAVRPGKEADVAALLQDGLAVVQREPAAIAWFAIPTGRGSVEVFDAFPDDAARRTHLSGRVAGGLMARAEELFAPTPAFDPFVETTSERSGGG